MLKIYGIKNCNSMKKAFTYLDEHQIPYEFHDYKKVGITADKLLHWLKLTSVDVVLNKKGTTWKKLNQEEQIHALQDQQQLIETLIKQPSMIKRPILETASGLIIGFDETQYSQLK